MKMKKMRKSICDNWASRNCYLFTLAFITKVHLISHDANEVELATCLPTP